MFDKNTWNHLTVYKQMNSNKSIKNKVTDKIFAYQSFIHRYLILNYSHGLIYDKIPTNQPINIIIMIIIMIIIISVKKIKIYTILPNGIYVNQNQS